MLKVLEIEYRGSGWGLGLRAAIDANPGLRVRDRGWRQGPLSDLAFAISTRLAYLPEIVQLVDENLAELNSELAGEDAEIAALLRSEYCYTFKDYGPVRRVLLGAASFITESRSCFENLARFYREFLKNYFDQFVGDEAASYTAVAQMAPSPQWADDLKRVRHDLLHQRSLWLAFEVNAERRARYEPMLLLNWRPGTFQPKDCIPFQTLRNIRGGVTAAATGLQDALIARVRAAG